MKPQRQQQQEQMRKQQEQMRRQQMGDAWKKQQEQAPQQQEPDLVPQEITGDKFSQVETEASRLRKEYAAGSLSEEKFKSQLKDLMVKDENGTWWMIGTESNRWYRHDGSAWVQAVPPTSRARSISTKPKVKPAQPTRGSKGKAYFIFIFGTIISGALFWIVAALTESLIPDRDLSEMLSIVFGVIAGFVGLRITWRRALRAVRGE
ncbi:MAG: hypothetical protein MUO76_12740 [Anaerolineaceae bacterium]|nr:hypothetical protein [Anaerolineaceae bacterium]